MAAAIEERGRCTLALSGGTTPVPMFRRLAAGAVAWRDVEIFQVDERDAPVGHTDRNLTLIERELVDRIRGDRPRVHPMPVDTGDLDAAADAYASVLVDVCGDPPVLDVVHLGLGPDGHTASLVPGDPVLDVVDRWVAVTGEYNDYRRMTLTYPALDRARRAVLFVTEAEKAEALAKMVVGDRSVPAGRLEMSRALVFADPGAAGSLSAYRAHRRDDAREL